VLSCRTPWPPLSGESSRATRPVNGPDTGQRQGLARPIAGRPPDRPRSAHAGPGRYAPPRLTSTPASTAHRSARDTVRSGIPEIARTTLHVGSSPRSIATATARRIARRLTRVPVGGRSAESTISYGHVRRSVPASGRRPRTELRRAIHDQPPGLGRIDREAAVRHRGLFVERLRRRHAQRLSPGLAPSYHTLPVRIRALCLLTRRRHASVGRSLSDEHGMLTGTLRDEASCLDPEAAAHQPCPVRRFVGAAPEHRGASHTQPVVFRAGPHSVVGRAHKSGAGLQPTGDPLEQPPLLVTDVVDQRSDALFRQGPHPGQALWSRHQRAMSHLNGTTEAVFASLASLQTSGSP
jgi:hypothetical protein